MCWVVLLLFLHLPSCPFPFPALQENNPFTGYFSYQMVGYFLNFCLFLTCSDCWFTSSLFWLASFLSQLILSNCNFLQSGIPNNSRLFLGTTKNCIGTQCLCELLSLYICLFVVYMHYCKCYILCIHLLKSIIVIFGKGTSNMLMGIRLPSLTISFGIGPLLLLHTHLKWLVDPYILQSFLNVRKPQGSCIVSQYLLFCFFFVWVCFFNLGQLFVLPLLYFAFLPYQTLFLLLCQVLPFALSLLLLSFPNLIPFHLLFH